MDGDILTVDRRAMLAMRIENAIGKLIKPQHPQQVANIASAALDIALEEAAKVVTEHYEELCTEHRLLVINRAAAIRALMSKP